MHLLRSAPAHFAVEEWKEDGVAAWKERHILLLDLILITVVSIYGYFKH